MRRARSDPEPFLSQKGSALHLSDGPFHQKDPVLDVFDRSFHQKDPALDVSDRPFHQNDPALHVFHQSLHRKDPAFDVFDRLFHRKHRALDVSDPSLRPGDPTLDVFGPLLCPSGWRRIPGAVMVTPGPDALAAPRCVRASSRRTPRATPSGTCAPAVHEVSAVGAQEVTTTSGRGRTPMAVLSSRFPDTAGEHPHDHPS